MFRKCMTLCFLVMLLAAFLSFGGFVNAADDRCVPWNNSERTAATSAAQGEVELAIASEVNTGTDTERAITPDALAGSSLGSKEAVWVIVDSDAVTAVADGKKAFVVPATMNGMNLIDVTASVHDLNSASGGTTTVVLRRVREAAAVDMTSTGVTIAFGDYTASDEVVDAANDDLVTGDKIYVDVDAVTTGAVQKGLSVIAVFRLP